MKLLNQSLKYLSIAILIIVALWSVVFYYSMLHEIKDAADEELENQKRLIIQNTLTDSIIIDKKHFDESLYTIQKVGTNEALAAKDQYFDTTILMQDDDDENPEWEPVRMLTSVFKVENNYYQLNIANPIIEQNDMVKALFWNIVALYLLLILSIILINNIILKKLWMPFYKFLEQLKSYKIENAKPLAISDSNITEFNDLQVAVDQMNQYNLNAYNRQKEFIENVSHELQTPIAIAINKLELLFEDGQLQNHQSEMLAETHKILLRLTKLNKSLLLLSKIDNRQHSELTQVSINKLVYEIKDELDDYISSKNLTINSLKDEPLFKKMDNAHATIMILNILKNAIIHNIENGVIEISIEKNQLIVANTGIPKSLDQDKIFNRFHKGNTSQSNTGLGLSIIKAIANLYALQISYQYRDAKHFFIIKF